ncbi:MAG: hypothetical protein QM770_01180 [Tepidisphaeraceae bacterium]
MVSGSSHSQFGVVVAYLVPGFVALLGLLPVFPMLSQWLSPIPWGEYGEMGLGPPIYALLAATAAGMVTNYVRWFFIDSLHRTSGVRGRTMSFARLGEQLEAYHYLVEQQYRHYQFAGNMLVAIPFAYTMNRLFWPSAPFGVSTDAAVLLICLVLFVGSRDTLTKFRSRVDQLIGSADPVDRAAEEGGSTMANGIDHPKPNPADKPAAPGTTKGAPPATSKPDSPKK